MNSSISPRLCVHKLNCWFIDPSVSPPSFFFFFLIKIESSDIVGSCCRGMEKSWAFRSRVGGLGRRFTHWCSSNLDTVGNFIENDNFIVAPSGPFVHPRCCSVDFSVPLKFDSRQISSSGVVELADCALKLKVFVVSSVDSHKMISGTDRSTTANL